MAGITVDGYQLVSSFGWFFRERGRYLAIDSRWNLDVGEPDYEKINNDSIIWGNFDRVGLEAYNSRDIDLAEKNDLDSLAKIFFLNRLLSTASSATVNLTGIAGTEVPAGSIVISSIDRTRWTTNADVDITGPGNFPVVVTSEQKGPVTAAQNTLTVIGTPISGWQTVNNPASSTIGIEQERDDSFRRRIKRSRALQGNNQLDSMIAAIGSISGVSQLEIYENKTGSTDSNGLQPNSIAVFVQGGADAEIALQMARYKNPGTNQNKGNNTIGTPVQIATRTPGRRFVDVVIFRPTEIDIFIEVDLQAFSAFPANINALVTQSIIEYVTPNLFEGETVEGFNRTGFGIGEDVPPGRFYTPVNKIIGIYGRTFPISLRVGTSDANLGTTPIAIAFNQIAVFNEANIEII